MQTESWNIWHTQPMLLIYILSCSPTANSEELSEMEDIQRALYQLKANAPAESGKDP